MDSPSQSATTDPVCMACMVGRRAEFVKEGFVIVDEIIDGAMCVRLQDQLEKVLRGQFDVANGRPDKAPSALSPPKLDSLPLGGPSKQTLQATSCHTGGETHVVLTCRRAMLLPSSSSA